MPQVLIATLGTEPQVVTATIDLLRRQRIWPVKVIILHTLSNNPHITGAVETLQKIFSRDIPTKNITGEFHSIPGPQGTLNDVDTEESARSFFVAVYRLVKAEKQAGNIIHLSIAGGRKTMALFGMLIAQLLFDEVDRLWYLVSSGEYLQSKRLHPRAGDDVHLVQIPVVLWSQVSPAFSQLKDIEDPFTAIERVRSLRMNEKIDAARIFILRSLTPAERRAVALLVMEGLSDQAIAGRLSLSARTVEGQLRAAYAKAADYWEMEEVNRAQLITLLQLYYSTKLGETPHDRIVTDQ